MFLCTISTETMSETVHIGLNMVIILCKLKHNTPELHNYFMRLFVF